MIKDIMNQAREEMGTSLESLSYDLGSIRTGRASTALVEKIRVDYYGTSTALIQMALISVPEAQMITIRPYDPGAIKDIERALMQSDLGITPNNDGKLIRLQIPALTEDRRRMLAKQVHTRVEEARVSIRNHRRDILDHLRDLEKEKLITEDELFHGKEELQKITDDYSERAAEIGRDKEAEIMSL